MSLLPPVAHVRMFQAIRLLPEEYVTMKLRFAIFGDLAVAAEPALPPMQCDLEKLPLTWNPYVFKKENDE